MHSTLSLAFVAGLVLGTAACSDNASPSAGAAKTAAPAPAPVDAAKPAAPAAPAPADAAKTAALVQADAAKPIAQVQTEAKAEDVSMLQKMVAGYNAEVAKHQDQINDIEGKLKDAVSKALGGQKVDTDALKAQLSKLQTELKDLKDKLAVYVQALAAKQK